MATPPATTLATGPARSSHTIGRSPPPRAAGRATVGACRPAPAYGTRRRRLPVVLGCSADPAGGSILGVEASRRRQVPYGGGGGGRSGLEDRVGGRAVAGHPEQLGGTG